MKLNITVTRLFSAFIIPVSLFGTEITELQKKIDALIATEKQAHIGIKVVSLSTGDCLYEKDGDRLFTPASNIKLFTSALAYEILGKDFKFITIVGTDGEIQEGVLNGNLYLKGSGDPSLMFSHLEEFVLTLKKKDIKMVAGDIIADATIFDELPFGAGWTWDDGAAFYNAPISGLNTNYNCIKFSIKASNSQLTVCTDPKTDYITYINSVHIANPSGPVKLQVKRRWLKQENTFDISGMVPQNCDVREFTQSIENPPLYSATLFAELCKKHGILIKGCMRQGVAPELVTILASHTSEPLSSLLGFCMKTSNNLYAECIFKALSAYHIGKPGADSKSKDIAINFIMGVLNVSKNSFRILEGAGSRYNLVSPNLIIKLLVWVSQTDFFNNFVSWLAISGVDGTLIERLSDPVVKEKIKAKTGTMNNVSALSGYITTEGDETLAFSILINGIIADNLKECRALEDAICVELASFKCNKKGRTKRRGFRRISHPSAHTRPSSSACKPGNVGQCQ